MTHICGAKICHHWFRKWLAIWPVTSHFLNHCWLIINWTLTDIFQWNFHQIRTFWLKKMHLFLSSTKGQPSCLGHNELTTYRDKSEGGHSELEKGFERNTFSQWLCPPSDLSLTYIPVTHSIYIYHIYEERWPSPLLKLISGATTELVCSSTLNGPFMWIKRSFEVLQHLVVSTLQWQVIIIMHVKCKSTILILFNLGWGWASLRGVETQIIKLITV